MHRMEGITGSIVAKEHTRGEGKLNGTDERQPDDENVKLDRLVTSSIDFAASSRKLRCPRAYTGMP